VCEVLKNRQPTLVGDLYIYQSKRKIGDRIWSWKLAVVKEYREIYRDVLVFQLREARAIFRDTVIRERRKLEDVEKVD